jgi:hypothetical protein
MLRLKWKTVLVAAAIVVAPVPKDREPKAHKAKAAAPTLTVAA